jgi:hypothetical protein
VGGIAFDYSRMVSLDTEIQAAADQAALAAARQLDRQDGAMARAREAVAALQNQTRFANDGRGAAITIPAANIQFFRDYDDGAGVSTPATVDADAGFVRVTVDGRSALFALTPVVGLLREDGLSASAVAGMSSAICNTPPVMMCNPEEPIGNVDPLYAFNAPPGTGLLLTAGSADTPGNFGFLETGFGSGANDLQKALSWDQPPGGCVSSQTVTTKTGLNNSVMQAINTRFDMLTGNVCPSGGTCSASINTRKDLIQRPGQCALTNGAGTNQNVGWEFVPSISYQNFVNATTPAALSQAQTDSIPVMGHPRDICHVRSPGSCPRGSRGTGVWDRSAYFRVNYGNAWAANWVGNTGLSASATRYEVYRWEVLNRARMQQRELEAGRQNLNNATNVNQQKRLRSAPSSASDTTGSQCNAPSLTPGPNVIDRRRMSVAVVNCNASRVAGKTTNLPVVQTHDVFLVEPSYNRCTSYTGGGNCSNNATQFSSDRQFYVEVIGVTGVGGPNSTAALVRRDVPRLLE